jgi:hypothetical protein
MKDIFKHISATNFQWKASTKIFLVLDLYPGDRLEKLDPYRDKNHPDPHHCQGKHQWNQIFK